MRRLALTGALLLGACGMEQAAPTVIDGSSPEAFQRTVAAARSELGPRDLVKFDAALSVLRGRQFDRVVARTAYERSFRETFNGQTALQIVEGAEEWSQTEGSETLY